MARARAGAGVIEVPVVDGAQTELRRSALHTNPVADNACFFSKVEFDDVVAYTFAFASSRRHSAGCLARALGKWNFRAAWVGRTK